MFQKCFIGQLSLFLNEIKVGAYRDRIYRMILVMAGLSFLQASGPPLAQANTSTLEFETVVSSMSFP